jgi:hypothetical protein
VRTMFSDEVDAFRDDPVGYMTDFFETVDQSMIDASGISNEDFDNFKQEYDRILQDDSLTDQQRNENLEAFLFEEGAFFVGAAIGVAFAVAVQSLAEESFGALAEGLELTDAQIELVAQGNLTSETEGVDDLLTQFGINPSYVGEDEIFETPQDAIDTYMDARANIEANLPDDHEVDEALVRDAFRETLDEIASVMPSVGDSDSDTILTENPLEGSGGSSYLRPGLEDTSPGAEQPTYDAPFGDDWPDFISDMGDTYVDRYNREHVDDLDDFPEEPLIVEHPEDDSGPHMMGDDDGVMGDGDGALPTEPGAFDGGGAGGGIDLQDELPIAKPVDPEEDIPQATVLGPDEEVSYPEEATPAFTTEEVRAEDGEITGYEVTLPDADDYDGTFEEYIDAYMEEVDDIWDADASPPTITAVYEGIPLDGMPRTSEYTSIEDYREAVIEFMEHIWDADVHDSDSE